MKIFECKIKDINAIVLDVVSGKQSKVIDGIDIDFSDPDDGFSGAKNINITIKDSHFYEHDKRNILQLVNIQQNISQNIVNLNIILKKNTEINILHCDEMMDETACKTQCNLNIVLEENAKLTYFHFDNVNNFSEIEDNVHISQRKNSIFKPYYFVFNGQHIMRNLLLNLNENNAKTSVKGLYLLDKTQKFRNDIKLNHNVSNCKSRQLFKGILDDSADAEFNGHILVARDAQKTEAYQNNKNLLLTDKAKMKTQPFLEIYADDVKCTHGASTGQFDKEAIFYMRQRGISEKNAISLLMFAFANEITSDIEINSMNLYVQNLIRRRLNGEDLKCESCRITQFS
ncbi:MAG: SufD family Fe-S cluster assembly protein [Bacteroidales bacterium]|nr:SufD family Fe-S cluster assembly protein [Bacteroidales bacterium]